MRARSLESPGERAQACLRIYTARTRPLKDAVSAWGIACVTAFAILVGAIAPAQAQVRVASPDGRNALTIEIREGRLAYSLQRDGRALLLPSRLGFEFGGGAPPLREGLRLVDTARHTVDETWTQPWGEVARVRDHHNELLGSVPETAPPNRRFSVAFRVFNDGVGFRYELPEQPGLGAFAITEELTEFALADDARAWWIPSNRPRLDRSEMLYSSSPVSVMDSVQTDRKSTRLNSSHVRISYAVFCLKKKKTSKKPRGDVP